MNVYWINNNGRRLIRLDDANGEYIVDVATDEMYLVVRSNGLAFAARSESENPDVVVVIPNGNPSRTEVEVDGKLAGLLVELTGEAKEEYLGVVSGPTGGLKFWSAKEHPEEKIDKL